MLDEFGTDKAEDYIAGFPEHPHRGFETVTYMLDGRMRHKDNHGNEGVLVPGAVQWMTAGRGIVHSEMPEQTEGKMRGFQLWLNLPARDKMTAPNYQEFGPRQDCRWWSGPACSVKVIAGELEGVGGPGAPTGHRSHYLDIRLDAGVDFTLPVPAGHSAFVYVYEGGAVRGRRRVRPPRSTRRNWRCWVMAARFVSGAARREPAPSSSPAGRCTSRWRGMVRS